MRICLYSNHIFLGCLEHTRLASELAEAFGSGVVCCPAASRRRVGARWGTRAGAGDVRPGLALGRRDAAPAGVTDGAEDGAVPGACALPVARYLCRPAVCCGRYRLFYFYPPSRLFRFSTSLSHADLIGWPRVPTRQATIIFFLLIQ